MTGSRDDTTAANIRAEVARRRVKQRDLAEELGLTQQAVSRRLNGQVEFTANEVKVVAALLGISVASLLDEHPVMATSP